MKLQHLVVIESHHWSRVSSKQSKFFFGSNQNKAKLYLFWLFRFVSWNQKHFSVCFGLFQCFGPVSKQPKQTELCRNKPKNLQKSFLLGVLETVNFFLGSNLNKPKLNLFWLFFRNQQIFFRFVSVFCTGIETTETNRTYGMGIKKVDILTNLLLFRLVFCLFWNTETSCFDIKAKKPKQTSCFW